MTPTRRQLLLKTAAAIPVVFGIGALGVRRLFAGPEDGEKGGPPPFPGPKAGPPAWWTQALERMKEDGRPGIVLKIPQKKGPRLNLGAWLVAVLDGSNAVRNLFLEAVFVCLNPKDLAACVPGAKGDEDVVLVDEGGRRVDGIALDLVAATRKETVFRDAVGALLHDDPLMGVGATAKGARLEARATAARKRVPEDVLAALDRLETDADAALVAANMTRVAAPFALALSGVEPGPRRERLLRVVGLVFEGASPFEPGPRLPYGIEIEKGGCGCGGQSFDDEGNPVMVACGMAMADADARRFMAWLGG